MAAYGKTDNYHYPTHITNPDEMPNYIFSKPSAIIDGIRDQNYMSGGVNRFLNNRFNMVTKNIPEQRPQNEIGSMMINHPYPEGSYGQQMVDLTSTSSAPIVPTGTSFMRKSTNVAY